MAKPRDVRGPRPVRAWPGWRLAPRSPLTGAAVLAGLAAATLLARLYVVRAAGTLNADEAIEGLMALHISQARHLPTFFYGQSYFGALEAYLAAALFKLAGFHPLALIAFPVLFSTWLALAVHRLGALVWSRRAGLLAAMLIAVPPAPVARLFVSAAGGYALAFFLQTLALVLLLESLRGHPADRGFGLAFGFVSGLAAWVWQPYLAVFPVLLATLLVLNPRARRPLPLGALLLLFLLGAAPLLQYNVRYPLATLAAAGKNLSFTGETAEPGGPWRGLELFWVALGGGYESIGGGNPLLAVLGALGPPALFVLLRDRAALATRTSPLPVSPARIALVLAAAGLAGALAAHATARHLLPTAFLCWLAGAAALVAAARRPWLLAGGLVLLLGVNVAGYRAGAPAFQEFVAGLEEVQQAIHLLDESDLTAGYGDYWSAYPITYLTGERIVVAPALPTLWGGPFDRYPAYAERVRGAERPFFLIEGRCVSLEALRLAMSASGHPFRTRATGRWLLIVPESDAAAAFLHRYAAGPLPC